MHDLPKFNSRAASYLLAALLENLPTDCIVLAVVDPGVGSSRRAIAVYVDERWLLAPDNGLLDVVAKRANNTKYYEINVEAQQLSASFHARDLFMPVAVSLFNNPGIKNNVRLIKTPKLEHVPDELAEVIYIDSYGNLMTGLTAALHQGRQQIIFKGYPINRARTFSDNEKTQAFFYENSQGLLEIAINCGNAQQRFSAEIGDMVELELTFIV